MRCPHVRQASRKLHHRRGQRRHSARDAHLPPRTTIADSSCCVPTGPARSQRPEVPPPPRSESAHRGSGAVPRTPRIAGALVRGRMRIRADVRFLWSRADAWNIFHSAPAIPKHFMRYMLQSNASAIRKRATNTRTTADVRFHKRTRSGRRCARRWRWRFLHDRTRLQHARRARDGGIVQCTNLKRNTAMWLIERWSVRNLSWGLEAAKYWFRALGGFWMDLRILDIQPPERQELVSSFVNT